MLKYYTKQLCHISQTKLFLKKLFCRYGAPEKFVADNGWQFAHNETFDVIMKEFGVTPYHPETNGEIQKDAIKT